MSSQQQDKAVVTTVLLSPDQHEALKRISVANHRTMSGQVRAWIEAADDHVEIAAA